MSHLATAPSDNHQVAWLLAVVALSTLSGCAEQIQRMHERQLEQQQATCADYGAGPGAPGYTDCMLRLRAEGIAAAQAAQDQYQAGVRAQQQIGIDTLRAMTAPVYVPRTQPITCMPMGGGMVSCNSY